MNARARRCSPRHAGSLAAGGLLIAAATLTGCGSTAPRATDPAAVSTATAQPAAPTSSSAASASSALASNSASGSASSSAPPSSVAGTASGSPVQASATALHTVTVPVYYVIRSPKGPRLVQERHAVPAANRLAGAVQALETQPHDPDYTSFYHADDLGDVHFDGHSFTVVLTHTALAKRGTLSADEARIAVQQLAYTLAAVQGAPGAATQVTAGGTSTTLFGIATGHGVKPGNQLTTLADVNVLSPAQGSTQSATLVAQGLANSPEANVPWQITDAHGTVVKKGAATATGWMDKLYPWTAKIDISGLTAGRYTFAASTENQADAGEGSTPTVDTKTFVVS